MDILSGSILGLATVVVAGVIRSLAPVIERSFMNAIDRLLGESKFERLLSWVAVAVYGASEAALREFIGHLDDGLQTEDAKKAWVAFKDTLVAVVSDNDKLDIFGIENDSEILRDLDKPDSRNRKIVVNALKYNLN